MKKLYGFVLVLMFFFCAAAAQAQCTLGEALDAPDLTWATGGAANWFCQTDAGPFGDAAQSGAIGDNQISWLETTVSVLTPKILSFYWIVKSQPGQDYLRFFINGSEYSSISGDPAWAQVALSLSPGTTYTLRWEYVKDASGAAPFDYGRVDGVTISDPPVVDLLAHYAEMYAIPRIPTPLFVKERVAKAQPDECYANGTAGEPDEAGNCDSGEPKTNQAYVWGLAQSGNLWFGTAANVLCLVMGGLGASPVEAPNFVCEFNESENGLGQLGDWRPPQIFEYNPDTMMLIDRTPLDMHANPTLGIRSAGALDGVVLLAGPSLNNSAVNVFAFSDDGTYLGMHVLTGYNNIRQWVVHEGVMYTGMSTTLGAGRVLRWNGDSSDPFQFEVVGKLDLDSANMAVHEDRLFSTTWPSFGMPSPNVMGLWMSPEIPDGGLTGSDNDTWQKVWSVSDYEPDLLVRRTYGGGALASYDGTLYWGTMHVPFLATQAAIGAHQNSLINLGGYDNSFGPDDIAATALGTHRAISIFSGRDFGTPGQTVELLYGDEYLPRYEPAERSFTIAEDNFHRNLMPNPVPKWGTSGIGNFFNSYTWTMDVGFTDDSDAGGVLLGTFDWSRVARELAELALGESTETEILLAVIDQLQLLYASYGADLYVIQSADEPFVLESINGAGNEFNYGIRTMLMPDIADDGHGYLGMANPFNLAEEGGWELISIYPRECTDDYECNDGRFCTGRETCDDDGVCRPGRPPCMEASLCNEAKNRCDACSNDADCNDGVFCSGTETCGDGMCVPGTPPCSGEQICAEDKGTCVECMTKSHCDFGYMCEEDAGVCAVQCPLTVATKKDKPIIVKTGKGKKVKLLITGGEGFDPNGFVDAGPFVYINSKYNDKKGVLAISVTVPAGLEPGTYQISVGECLGEVTFTAEQ